MFSDIDEVRSFMISRNREFNMLIKQIDMIDAYHRITDEHGPSQQLIAFINYDGNLSRELGLESFDNLSLDMKHRLLKANFQSDIIQDMAMENLADRIDKISNWIVGGALIAKKVNLKLHGVYPEAAFHKFEKLLEVSIDFEKTLIESIPNNFDLSAWETHYRRYNNFDSEIQNKDTKEFRAWREIRAVGLVLPSKSGWSVDSFNRAMKWFMDSVERVHNLELKYAEKLKKINTWVVRNKGSNDPDTKKLYRLINGSFEDENHAFSNSTDNLKDAKKRLDIISKMFEEVKK